MQLDRYALTSLKDKIDSLSFNGSDFAMDRVDELVSLLTEIRLIVGRGDFVSDDMLKRLSFFSEDPEVLDLIGILERMKKILENDIVIKNLEGKILFKWMNTFNEKFLLVISFLFLLIASGNFKWLEPEYVIFISQSLCFYVPVSLFLMAFCSGKSRFFDYILWSLVGVFVKDEVRAGNIVRGMVFELGAFRFNPVNISIIVVSAYFIFLFDYSALGVASFVGFAVYFSLFFISIFNKARNEKTQTEINLLQNENLRLNRKKVY